MAVTGHTQLVATKQDAIAALVQRELKYGAKLLPTITDVSAFAVKGLKSISFPKFNSFNVEKRSSTVAGTIQNLLATTDKLDLDQRAYISWLIENMDEYQSNVAVQAEYVKRAGSAHARGIDEDILVALNANKGHSIAAGIDKAKILEGREFLLKNQANLNDITLAVYTGDERAMLNINEFVEADKYGQSNIPNGVIGKVFGINVMLHTKPDLAASFMFSKEALAIGFQKGASYDEQKAIEYGTGSYRAAVDQLYGVKALRLGEGVDLTNAALASTESPFIVKIG